MFKGIVSRDKNLLECLIIIVFTANNGQYCECHTTLTIVLHVIWSGSADYYFDLMARYIYPAPVLLRRKLLLVDAEV
jgi:hypothetical protein